MTNPAQTTIEDWPEVAAPGGIAAAQLEQSAQLGRPAGRPVVMVAPARGAAVLDDQPAEVLEDNAGESTVYVAYLRTGTRARVARHRILAPAAVLEATPAQLEQPAPEDAAPAPAAAGRSRTTPAAGVTVCRTRECRAEIRMVDMESGKAGPVDAEPTPDGKLALVRTPAGWRMRVLMHGEDPQDDPRRWTSHFATCKRPQDHRKPAPARHLAAVPDAPAPGRLLAVDGNSLAHRAYHAYEKSAMRDADGRPVWAVYGFLALLAGIVDRTGPDAIVVGFDDRAGSARRDRFPDYKAGRAERSEDLYAQLEALPGLLAEMGVTVVTPDRLEADDVLASAAATAEAAGVRCTVATSDKDAFGLITEQVTVLRLVSGLDNAVTMTPAALVEKYGVTPGQWPDYVALVGDKSDNLPGAPGIGPKTAVKLLTACGTLDAALADPAAAAAAIGKAAAAKLAADAAAAAIARNRDIMAPVRTIPVDLQACRPAAAGGTVAAVLRRRGLPSLIERVTAALCRQAAPAPDGADVLEAAGMKPERVRAELVRAGRRRLELDAAPVVLVTAAPAPTLAALGADQDDDERTCSTCSTVCPAAMPALDGSAMVLLDRESGLYDQLAVDVEGRWHVRPVGDSEHGLPFWNRRRTHQCPVYTHPCQTPGHAPDPGQPPNARLIPGGAFCDECLTSRAAGD